MLLQILIGALCFFAGAVLAWLLARLGLARHMIALSEHNQVRDQVQQLSGELAVVRTERQQAQSRQQELVNELNAERSQSRRLNEQVQTLHTTIARLEADTQSRQERLDMQKQDIEEVKLQMETQFRVLANDILETKSRAFSEQQETKLSSMLMPFREQISQFKKEFDEKFTQEVREKSSLRAEIANLLNLNQTIAREAVSLTEALRGSTKKQGDWGEDILERILEFSGLQKGIHYKVQASSRDEHGQTIRPDLIVHYPDQRFLVIDSKVSLNHYWDYCNAADAPAQEVALQQMVRSLKTHVDGLYSKPYIDIAGTPDFIIMFVPVEAAYITAMQHDHGLWQYAYTRKILLISPTNLIPAMKMISDMWQKDNINRDAERIAQQAVRLYEKLVGFIDNFESVGKELEQASVKWNDARKQLMSGKGNIVNQGEQLRSLLGKKTSKELPATMAEQARLDAEAGDH